MGSRFPGLAFAGRLAGSGCRTELVPRSAAQREELQANGVKVLEPDGEECRSRPIVTENPAGARDNPDWIFLMVKQKDIGAGLAGQLAGRMGESTRLLCFQNGAGHLERLGAMLPPDRIYAAVTTEAARKESPWEVRHTGKGTILWGIPKPFEGGRPQRLTLHLTTCFGEPGLPLNVRRIFGRPCGTSFLSMRSLIR
ncbi:2-dehydropantoate 2-reductase [Paenibacillus sp. CC-CFT747]|nr:2-dehydropantoate 2-reductase [Paenibacillus sp. CC-CFT747]